MTATDSMTLQPTAPEWDARPHVHTPPSRTALATRSLTAAMRLTGEAQRAALARHFAEFTTTATRSCRLHN